MSEVVPFRATKREDSLWAVIVRLGRGTRIADIHPNQAAAQADRDWRAAQVRSYSQFILRESSPLPSYSIRPIRRADLPRNWRPAPALGFLRGQFL